MKEVAAALKAFYSEFLPAYTEQSVPEEIDLPYITYPIIDPRWDQQVPTYLQIWHQKRHLPELLTYADQILAAISHGIKIKLAEGYLAIYPAQQQAQIRSDEATQSAYISLLINAYHQPGE